MPQFFNVQMNTQDVSTTHLGQSGRTSTVAEQTDSGQSFHSILKQTLPENSSHKQKSAGSTDDNPLSHADEDLNPETSQNPYQTPSGHHNSTQFAASTAAQSGPQGGTTSADDQQSQSLFPDLPVPRSVEASPLPPSPQQEALLKRLQSILDSSAEAGVLSVKNVQGPGSDSSLRLQQLNLAVGGLQGIGGPEIVTDSPLTKGAGFTTLQEGVFGPTLRNRQQRFEGVRHDKNQQFYDAKTQPQDVLNEQLQLTGKQQGDGMNGQGSGSSQTTALSAPHSESGSTFSLPANQGADPLTTQLSDTGKTTMLPSGTVVQDQEVMQQIVERFRVNKRLLETKIQLKLHPVELGKLEIDLTVKEGSIRANVVAQSQHVQEILEKNIARLKNILEQQGFSVEEISITSESDTVGGFDLFDKQLSHNESSLFQKRNDTTETHTPFVLDEFQESYVESPSGVNVKA